MSQIIEFVKWIFSLVMYYEKDKAAGKPYWQDPAAIALVVSILATEYAKYCGVIVSADLQLKIVGTITGIGALVSPHTGIVAKPPDPATEAKQVAKDVQQHNLTNLS
ncbi:MAG: hypothetical protein ABSH41_03925 [Syntrophobacteraceae bacterium]|jgi:hypothetical protein